uniref:Rhodopsin domain-containing protein n=1 Tax=Talaromyces marneffei PM1 TaxID=1077442 RepID=A0A093VNT6_TALMA
MALNITGAGAIPPIFPITDEDHGGYVAVSVYTLLALSVFVVATRLSARYYIGNVVQIDDYLLGVGTYIYVAQILMIATIALSKLSIGLLFQSLMDIGIARWANLGLNSAVIMWAVASIAVLAARCSSPHPWSFVDGKCDYQGVMFRAIGAFNIITDVVLVFLSCAVLWTVQVSMGKRLRIISLLAIRLVVVIAVAFQIHYYIILTESTDKTWAQMNASIWDQAVLNLSIIATSVPSLGRLAHELQPNVNAFAITENHGLRSRDKYTISSLANHYPRETAEQNMLGTHTSIHGSVDGDTESMEGLVRDGIQQNVFIQRTVELKVE